MHSSLNNTEDKHSQDFVKQIFDNLNIALYIINTENCDILFANKFVHKIFPNILEKKCYEHFFSNQTMPCSNCKNEELIKNNYSESPCKNHFNHYNQKWYYNMTQPIIWNKKVARLEISLDVTEFKSIENKSLENEHLLKNIINELPNPFVIKNYDGKFLLANKAVALLYGANSPEDMLGKDDGDYIPDKKQAEFFRKNVQAIMDSGKTDVVYEDSIDVESGERRNYMSIKKPYKNLNGKDEILVITNDITDIRKAEKTLLQYEKIISVSSDFLAYLNKDGIFQAVNDTYMNAFNLTREEIIGKGHKELLGEKHFNEHIKDTFERALQGKEIFYESWIDFPNKEKKFVHVTYHPYIPNGSNKIDGVVVQVSDLTERKIAEDRLSHFAYHDELTDLPNRRMFSERLSQSIARAKRQKKQLAVLFIDLDRFKIINDSLGHLVGDKMLKKVSTVLKEHLRKGDTLARSGGDEFLILIEEFDYIRDVVNICQNILNVLQEPLQIENHELFVTASIGVSIYPDDATNEEVLIQSADTAMYQAKKIGRNTYQLSNDEMRKLVIERFFLENNLRLAIENNELELFYQPQIHMQTKKIVGAEVLLRWNQPSEGMISPERFIPIAEESGLIITIGTWVLNRACEQMKQWIENGKNIKSISVNVSGNQLMQANFTEIVKNCLDTHSLDAQYLELEITESYLMNDTKEVINTLSVLKDLGVRISIDDFGTSYSSLRYLQQLPIEKLKIDRSFIKDIPSHSGDCAIVKTIISLAQNMNLQLIAEGVEEHDQASFLMLQGCTLAQGFLYERPIDKKTFEQKYL